MNEEILTAAAGDPHQSPSVTASPRGSQDGGAGIAPTRTLDMVTAEIKFLDAQAGRLVMGHALEIGRRLREAKDLVPYGSWGEYLEKQLGYTQTTANKLMKVYDEYGASQMGLFGPEIDSETFTNLTYSKALALLSVPREEREQFAREVDAEHLSTRELKEAIRERDEARKALADAEAREKEARDELAETAEMLDQTLEERNARGVIIREHEESLAALEKELEELKNRPIDVAVQQPDPEEVRRKAEAMAAELAKEARDEAEIERRAAASAQKAQAEAEKKAKEDLRAAKDKAKAEREKLEARLKEAEAKISAAGEADRAEAEKLRAEAEALRKQLAMSSQEITIFKLRFSAWQDAHKLMAEAFAALGDEETKERMRAAIRAQVKAWGWTE